MYTNYTDDAVFTEPRLNAICDFFFENLQTAFPPEVGDPYNEFVFKGCLLSGKAAAILQGDTGEITNVTFQVKWAEIYNWLVENLGKVFNCKLIAFKNRILLYPQSDLFFEFWFTEAGITPVTLGTIQMQNIANIPPQTL